MRHPTPRSIPAGDPWAIQPVLTTALYAKKPTYASSLSPRANPGLITTVVTCCCVATAATSIGFRPAKNLGMWAWMMRPASPLMISSS